MWQEGILENIASTAAAALASADTASAPVTAESMNFASSSPSMGSDRR